jgi:hypothetical protein
MRKRKASTKAPNDRILIRKAKCVTEQLTKADGSFVAAGKKLVRFCIGNPSSSDARVCLACDGTSRYRNVSNIERIFGLRRDVVLVHDGAVTPAVILRFLHRRRVQRYYGDVGSLSE